MTADPDDEITLARLMVQCSEAADLWLERPDLKITRQTISDLYRTMAHLALAINRTTAGQ